MTHSPIILKSLGIFSALFFLVACNEEEFEKVKAEIADLNVELRAAKDERNGLNVKERELEKLIYNLEGVQKKEREVKVELSDIAEYHRGLKAAYDYTSSLSRKWEVATRKSLIGENLGLVRLTDKTLAGAVIVELDAEKVILKHSEGEETVKLAELPEAMRVKLIHVATIKLKTEIVN